VGKRWPFGEFRSDGVGTKRNNNAKRKEDGIGDHKKIG
jgi:hypothetical protein